MFRITLPIGAALHVNLPTGGATAFVHVGGGEFLTRIPPLLLAGLQASETPRGEPVLDQGHAVGWDGKTLPGDKPVQAFVYGFDASAAAAAVEAAAAGGDTFAQQMLGEIEAAEKTLRAQQAVGLVPAEG